MKIIEVKENKLAYRVGIGRPALSAIENGGEFKVQTLERLVSSLDVSEQYIMHGKTEDTKASLIS